MGKLLPFRPRHDSGAETNIVDRMIHKEWSSPDQVAAIVRERYPKYYVTWRKQMIRRCQRSVRKYSADPHPTMAPEVFIEDLFSIYESGVVEEVFERMTPKLIKR